jgi:hypothetical protein
MQASERCEAIKPQSETARCRRSCRDSAWPQRAGYLCSTSAIKGMLCS